jgi:hypothetical protein
LSKYFRILQRVLAPHVVSDLIINRLALNVSGEKKKRKEDLIYNVKKFFVKTGNDC